MGNVMRGSCDCNTSGGGSHKRLVFVVVFIDVGLILRAEALMEHPDEDVVINDNSALKVLEFVESVLKFIAILIWI